MITRRPADQYLTTVIRLLCAVCLLLPSLAACNGQISDPYNLSFEKLDKNKKPEGLYSVSFNQQYNGYITRLDSSGAQQGKYAVSIQKTATSAPNNFGAFFFTIPAKFKGNRIKFTGYVKTEHVDSGFAGLWLRIDGSGKVLQFDNMASRGIKNTTAWREYSIELPYNQQEASNIVFGALLTGSGKMSVDNLHVFIDDKPIETASVKELFPAQKDTSFSVSSRIATIDLNEDKIKLLANVGMIWGFLKYYHPAITSGKYNWDAELFRHLPAILTAKNNAQAYTIIERWIDSLGAVPACDHCSIVVPAKIKLKPDYGYLFTPDNLPASLVHKLQWIRDNYKPVALQYYVGFTPAGNPDFKNETGSFVKYPDAGIRLLSLYRYWNIIQYFYPSRYLTGEDWNKVLSEFIPRFVRANNAAEYTLACLEIIAHIHDTHANIWGSDPTLDSLKGNLMTPFQAKFIENKLVVTGYYTKAPDTEDKIHIGDVIQSIDGTPVDQLIKKYLPLTPASNYQTQLRDLPSAGGFLLRSNKEQIDLQLKRKDALKQVTISRIPLSSVDRSIDYLDPKQTSGYKMLPDNIGYIYPGKLKEGDIDPIRKLFANTKGIIIDLRSYPSTFMPFTYGAWLKSVATPFVYFTLANLDLPGTISVGNTVSNGNDIQSRPVSEHYKGKVVILVNASTQSSGEYTAMALSTTPGATVIGSTTAGADGNVSTIVLPGGITSYISGLGVYYPDGTEAQRKGVKIDIAVNPTVESIRAGRDELLDKAIEIISKN